MLLTVLTPIAMKIVDNLMQQSKSKTVKIGAVMGISEGAALALTYLQPVLTEQQFGIISAVIAFSTPILMVALRQVTTQPISEK